MRHGTFNGSLGRYRLGPVTLPPGLEERLWSEIQNFDEEQRVMGRRTGS
jgi:hypothetical protein